MHGSSIRGHSGYDKTLHRLRRDFYWESMKNDVKIFNRNCETCPCIRTDQTRPSGLLQPLPIPSQPWTQTSIDFIEGLPPSHGFNSIWVVVHRFTKYSHFVPITHRYITKTIAQLFYKHVLKLHRMPNSIVFDRNGTFTSHF